jgi:hypothetical protein
MEAVVHEFTGLFHHIRVGQQTNHGATFVASMFHLST